MMCKYQTQSEKVFSYEYQDDSNDTQTNKQINSDLKLVYVDCWVSLELSSVALSL